MTCIITTLNSVTGGGGSTCHVLSAFFEFRCSEITIKSWMADFWGVNIFHYRIKSQTNKKKKSVLDFEKRTWDVTHVQCSVKQESCNRIKCSNHAIKCMHAQKKTHAYIFAHNLHPLCVCLHCITLAPESLVFCKPCQCKFREKWSCKILNDMLKAANPLWLSSMA